MWEEIGSESGSECEIHSQVSPICGNTSDVRTEEPCANTIARASGGSVSFAASPRWAKLNRNVVMAR
jgi:hypothetical protein